jgi:hypothetical protein
VRKSLLENLGQLDRALRLVTLRKDVPLDAELLFARPVVKPVAAEATWDRETGEVTFETSGHATVPDADMVSPPGTTTQATRGPEEVAAISEESTAMVVSGSWTHALEPRSAKEAYILARHMFESRMFSAYGNTDAVFATIVAGRELGIPALTALRSIHVIEGKPTLSAHLIVALVLRSGFAEYFRLIESTDE